MRFEFSFECVEFEVVLTRLPLCLIPEGVIHIDFNTNIAPRNGHCSAAVSSMQVEMVSRHVDLVFQRRIRAENTLFY